ncbi:MAG TPA: hypothetical protein VKC56_06920 [Gallionellaceae bacterium]|nr:hypothetical protein [Gallionellaceae bacterium]
MKILTGLGPFLFLGVTVSTYQSDGLSWTTFALACMIPFSILGFVDALSTRVEFRGETLTVVRNLRRAEYPRASLISVMCAKGMHVSVRRVSGEVVELPDVGESNQGLARALRTWLKPAADNKSMGADSSDQGLFEYLVNIVEPGPRPPFYQVVEHLWGVDCNVDSDGDSRTLEDTQWTELAIELREADEPRVDFDPVSTDPLVLQVRSFSADLAQKVARFIAARSGGVMEPMQREGPNAREVQ